MATKKQISDFIAKVGPMARADMKTSGILASITIAQACLESAYGTSKLAKEANALFGIKKHDWTGPTYTKKSYEEVNGKKKLKTSVFRAYGSWQESVNDHSHYLNTRKADGKNLTYKAVKGETDYKKAARALQKAGYSTYTDYADQLIGLIDKYNLTEYDIKVVAKKKTSGKKIFLDAGHGGKDPGACHGSRTEAADNLKLVKAVGAKLVAAGFNVVYDRTTNTYHGPSEKAERANKAGADYFFSFHRNAADGHAKGYETIYYSKSDKKDKIRKGLAAGMARCGFLIRADKQRTNLAVLHKTNMPALLLEVGFIDSDADNRVFDNKFDMIATEIAAVIKKNCMT